MGALLFSPEIKGRATGRHGVKCCSCAYGFSPRHRRSVAWKRAKRSDSVVPYLFPGAARPLGEFVANAVVRSVVFRVRCGVLGKFRNAAAMGRTNAKTHAHLVNMSRPLLQARQLSNGALHARNIFGLPADESLQCQGAGQKKNKAHAARINCDAAVAGNLPSPAARTGILCIRASSMCTE